MGKLEEDYQVEIEESTNNNNIVVGDLYPETTSADVMGAPAYGSDEWNDYVMNLFHEDEIIDGNPLCHGLRRVANLLLGDIISSGPTQVFPALDPDGPGRATVMYEIEFDWMNSGISRRFGDVAEVWHGNTDDLFAAHPAATACTKAEGRCLRKALMVKCVAFEELAKNKDVAGIVKSLVKAGKVTSGEVVATDSISDPQANFIDGKCRQLGINVVKYLNSHGTEYKFYKDIDKRSASDMIKKLNSFQTNDSSIPVDLLGYDPNWKNA